MAEMTMAKKSTSKKTTKPKAAKAKATSAQTKGATMTVEEILRQLKSLGDAIHLRNRVIATLEEADTECADAEDHGLLTFVVAGGGFAGVETIGALNDFVRDAIRFYPRLQYRPIRMVLVRAASAAAVVHPSKESTSGAMGAARWSINQTESKPAASAASVRSRMVGKVMRNCGKNSPNHGGVIWRCCRRRRP